MTEKEFKRLRDLAEAGKASAEELRQLKPYRVKRAILLAAGIGERLRPITINTPKPLVRVNRVRMIDTLIDALLQADIKEIYVVRGYMPEQFEELRYKYPCLKFIDNPTPALDRSVDSIASIWKAREKLNENVYVCSTNLVVYNPKIIHKYNYCSSVLGFSAGRPDCYQAIGIHYWAKEDAERLKSDIHKVFTLMENGRELCWDDLALGRFKLIPCTTADVVEINTWEELKAIDPTYQRVGGE